MNKSIRLRLTVWYLAFFSALLLVFGLFLYGILARALQQRLDDTLLSQANTTAVLFQDELREMNGDRAKAALEAVSEMRLRGSTVAVFDGAAMLAASGPVDRGEFEAVAARALASAPAESVLALESGAYGARAAARRIAGDTTYVVLAVEPLTSIASSLQIVRRVLMFGFPLLLVLAGLGGYWLSTRSLAPLGSMAEQAHRISGSNLHARLEIAPAAAELTMLAASFNALLSRLDQSFESMRRFVADASHELRTPIAVIRGEADVALSHPRDALEYRESLAVILDESRRLSRLVDDLLNLARADAGHVRLEVRDFYFNDLIGECCRSVQSLAAQRQIEVECRTGGDVPFRGDEELLRRLVMNLLDNAIRYTPVGGKVRAELETRDGEVRVRISDTGEGIAPEKAVHVFERFYRGDPSRSRDQGGFGLGLSIVKWIAESHRGHVDLSSGPEAGSVFTVSLPRAVS